MNKLSMRLAACLLACLAASCALGADTIEAELARELEPLLGPAWYGVYFGGQQKCGFATITLAKENWEGQEVYAAGMLLDIDVRMGPANQKMQIGQARYYARTGELLGYEVITRAVMGESRFSGRVRGDRLIATSTMAGRTATQKLPAPDESLESQLAVHRLIRTGKPGETATFTLFEPTFSRAVTVTCRLLRFEDRVLDGVETRIGVVESTFKELGMQTTDYVTTGGVLLETVIGQIFTLRKEPEAVAKDARVAFDALRGGITHVDRPLGDARRLSKLRLRVSGIPREEFLLDDERQHYERGGEGAEAEHELTLTRPVAPENAPELPVKLGPDDEALAACLRPSPFLQSDAPEIVEAAREIVGDTTDAFEAARKIRSWVTRNVRKKLLAAMSNALTVLKKKEGDCSEHTVLFVALCRAAGIPARPVFGIAYAHGMRGFGYHAWAEVHVGRWVAMDPTWGEDLVDASHVKFGVGDTEGLGAVAALFGSLKLEVLEVEREDR